MTTFPETANPLPPGRTREVEDLLDAVCSWAPCQADVRAAALVGSWARGAARADSDVDIVLLTNSRATYTDGEDWLTAFGADVVVRTQQWGILTERRLARPSGLVVEVGIVSPAWASTEPLDAGTAQVAADGLMALYDPDGLLARLTAAVASRPGGRRHASRRRAGHDAS